MPTLYVKKIWTLNPTGYKYLNLDEAMKRYDTYLIHWLEAYDQDPRDKGKESPKTFKNWLVTEI